MILRILPALSWLIFLLTLAIEKGSRESMGIYRDLTYRRRVLDATLFTPELLLAYKVAIGIGVLAIAAVVWVKKIGVGKYRDLIALLASFTLFLMLSLYAGVEWLAYPLMCLSMLLVVAIQDLRLIYLRLQTY